MLLEKRKMDKHYKKLGGKEYSTEYDGFVCVDPFGKLISPNMVTHDFHEVIKKHDRKKLRHSCASLLVANDIPMKAIQEWLGHATFNITIPVPNSNTNPVAVHTNKSTKTVIYKSTAFRDQLGRRCYL
ncbi:MAG: tyrosine-type recombinase/integrase [Ruminococcus sp.]|nr:tyrosine-type recombinase/integrase [Ruminococcus sp.]